MMVLLPTTIFSRLFRAARISASLTKSTGRGLGGAGLAGTDCAGAATGAAAGSGADAWFPPPCLPARNRSTARDTATCTPSLPATNVAPVGRASTGASLLQAQDEA